MHYVLIYKYFSSRQVVNKYLETCVCAIIFLRIRIQVPTIDGKYIYTIRTHELIIIGGTLIFQ